MADQSVSFRPSNPPFLTVAQVYNEVVSNTSAFGRSDATAEAERENRIVEILAAGLPFIASLLNDIPVGYAFLDYARPEEAGYR